MQANSALFAPGISESGAQVVYAPAGDVPLADLGHIAVRMFALKGQQPSDPEERKLADMLTDEFERALDWPVPRSLTDGRALVTTVVMLPRRIMPGGVLAMSYFPIFADPKTLLAAYVPSFFWPEELRKEWQQLAEDVTKMFLVNSTITVQDDDEDDSDLSEPVVVELTPAAATELRKNMAKSGLAGSWLRVGVDIVDRTNYVYVMEFTRQAPDDKTQLAYQSHGVPIVINAAHVALLNGTVIDYFSNRGGFVFNKPSAAPE